MFFSQHALTFTGQGELRSALSSSLPQQARSANKFMTQEKHTMNLVMFKLALGGCVRALPIAMPTFITVRFSKQDAAPDQGKSSLVFSHLVMRFGL